MVRRLLLPTALAVFSACNAPPPKAWLRYEAADPKGWTLEDDRWSVTLLGAHFSVDLHRQQTRVELIVENRTAADREVRVGPEATRAAAIGELQRRPFDRSLDQDHEDVHDFVPYLSMQRVEVRANWRVVFDLDSPLGREPTIGQYLVLVIEVRDGKGGFERRLLPLIATNSGTSRAAR